MVSPYSTDITGRKLVPEGSQEDRSQSWDRVAFFLFCVGLLFMIFGSVQAVQAWPGVLGQVCILLACGVPALMALLVRLPDWLRTRRVPVVVFVAGGVLQVGLMVTGLSRDPASAFKGMVLFLVSGVCVLLSGYLLVRTRERLQTVMHLFTASFLVLCGYGMFEYYQSGLDTAHFKVNPVELFSNNPLPAGALLILLSMGPLCGWARSVGIAGKLGYGLVLLLGIAVIFLIGRKGPLIAMGAMALVYGWVRIKRFPDYLALGIVLAILSFPLWDSVISDRYLDRFNNAHSSLIRWENYFFGMSVLSNNFWSGVGFNGVYKEFVPDYQAVAYIDPKVPGYPRYKEFIWEHHTLENTWFSMLVETGVLFFTAYICLLAVSLRKAFQMGWQFICAHKERLVIALPVMGFMIEACTFDSLKFPNLNSVFHVSLVGFVGGISLSGSSALPDSNIPEPEAGSPALRKKTPVLKNSGLTGRDKGLWFGLSAIGALLAWLFYSSVPPAYFTEATLVVRPNLEYGPYNLEMYKTIADKESTRKEIIGRLGLRSPDGLGAMNVRQFESEFHPTSFFKITNKNNGGGQLVIQAKGPDPEITQAVCQAWADIMVEHGKRIHQEVAEVEISKRVVEVEVSEKNLIESRKKYDALKSKHSLELLQNEISTTSQMLAEARLRKERLESRLKKNRAVIAELDSSLNRGVQDPEMEQYVRHKKFRAELRVKILPKQILDFKNRVDHLSEKLSKLEAGKLDMETVSFALVQNLNSWNQIHNKDLINLDLIQRVFKGFPDEVEIVSGPEMPHGPVTSGILSKVMSGAFLGLVLGMMVSYVRKNFAGGNVRLSSELA